MMNIVALSLVVSSLAAATVWSPPPNKKEANRLIVLEYQSHEPESVGESSLRHVVEQAMDKLDEVASHLPNIGQATYQATRYIEHEPNDGTAEYQPSRMAMSKDKICDACRVCKEKLSSVAGKSKEKALYSKDKAQDAAEETIEKAKETVTGAQDAAKETKEKAKGTVKSDAQSSVKEGEKGMQRVKEMAVPGETEEKVKGSIKNVPESAAQSAVKEGEKGIQRVKKMAVTGETVEKVKGSIRNVAESVLEEGEKGMERVKEMAVPRETIEKVKASVKSAAESAVEEGEKGVDKGKGSIKSAVETTIEAGEKGVERVKEIVRRALRGAMPVGQLMGLSATYGACLWVTFVSSHVLATTLGRHQFGMVQSKLYPVYFRAMAYGIGFTLLFHVLGRRRGFLLSGDGVGMLQSANLLSSLAFVLLNMLYLEPQATKVMFERLKIEKEEGRGRYMSDLITDPLTGATTTTTATATATTRSRNEETREFAASKLTKSAAEQEEVKTRMQKLNKKLKSLNSYSSFLNGLTLMTLTCYLVYLAQHLHVNC